MSYQVLARKWRPKNFSDVIGQHHIIQVIKNSFRLNRIHHAYVLSGTRGIGKTSVARLFAKGLNCEKGVNFEMCCQCIHCQDIDLGTFIDLIEIDAASRTKVEDTRDFLDNVQYMPSKGRFKIYLIDEIHMLSKHSFNALLKILEEPPIHVKFILVTTEIQKIPKTILSRCIQFYFKPLDNLKIVEHLKFITKKENIIAESAALESLSTSAAGSVRDALNLLEQAIILGENHISSDIINNMFGVINIEHALHLVESLINSNIYHIMNKIEDYSILKINWDGLLSEILIILKKISMIQFYSNFFKEKNSNFVEKNYDQKLITLSNCITPKKLQLYYQILLLGRRELPYAPNGRIGIEMIMLRIASHYSEENIEKIYHDSDVVLRNKKKSLNNHLLNFKNHQSHLVNDVNVVNQYDTKVINTNNRNNNYCVNHNDPVSESDTVTEDITYQLLKARSKLLQHKTLDKIEKSKKKDNALSYNTINKNTTDIIKRFSKIKTNSPKQNLEITNKKINQQSQNTKFKLLKKVFQIAIKNDPWIFRIYQSSLPKLEKQLIMNSWREEISANKICLHVRSDYFHLNTQEIKNSLQNFLCKKMNISIQLDIKEDINSKNQTPMEYIYNLYIEELKKIKKEFYNDPHVKTIKKIFDVEFDENDIEMI